MNLQGGSAEGDDGGAEREGLLPRVTYEVAGVGQYPEEGMGGRGVDTEPVGNLRQRERLGRLGGEEVQNGDGSTGGQSETRHIVTHHTEEYFGIAKLFPVPTRTGEERLEARSAVRVPTEDQALAKAPPVWTA